jgi:hypothetical protein
VRGRDGEQEERGGRGEREGGREGERERAPFVSLPFKKSEINLMIQEYFILISHVPCR